MKLSEQEKTLVALKGKLDEDGISNKVEYIAVFSLIYEEVGKKGRVLKDTKKLNYIKLPK
jgi:hypothetical protein